MTVRPAIGSAIPRIAAAPPRAPGWSLTVDGAGRTHYTLRAPHRLGGVLHASVAFEPGTARGDVARRLLALRRALWGRDRPRDGETDAPVDAIPAPTRRKASAVDQAAEQALAAAMATHASDDRPPWDEEAEGVQAFAEQAEAALAEAIATAPPVSTPPTDPAPREQARPAAAAAPARAAGPETQLGFSF